MTMTVQPQLFLRHPQGNVYLDQQGLYTMVNGTRCTVLLPGRPSLTSSHLFKKTAALFEKVKSAINLTPSNSVVEVKNTSFSVTHTLTGDQTSTEMVGDLTNLVNDKGATSWEVLVAVDKLFCKVCRDVEESVQRQVQTTPLTIGNIQPRAMAVKIVDFLKATQQNAGVSLEVKELLGLLLWLHLDLYMFLYLHHSGTPVEADWHAKMKGDIEGLINGGITKADPLQRNVHFYLKISSAAMEVFETNQGVVRKFLEGLSVQAATLLIDAGVGAAALSLNDHGTAASQFTTVGKEIFDVVKMIYLRIRDHLKAKEYGHLLALKGLRFQVISDKRKPNTEVFSLFLKEAVRTTGFQFSIGWEITYGALQLLSSILSEVGNSDRIILEGGLRFLFLHLTFNDYWLYYRNSAKIRACAKEIIKSLNLHPSFYQQACVLDEMGKPLIIQFLDSIDRDDGKMGGIRAVIATRGLGDEKAWVNSKINKLTQKIGASLTEEETERLKQLKESQKTLTKIERDWVKNFTDLLHYLEKVQSECDKIEERDGIQFGMGDLNSQCIRDIKKILIDLSTARSSRRLLPQWGIDNKLLDHFVERTSEIEKMRGILYSNPYVVLKGPHGAGKSLLAASYAIGLHYDYCWQLSGADPISSLRRIASGIVNQNESDDSVLKKVKNKLRDEGASCIFIIDNVKDRGAVDQVLNVFFPGEKDCDSGHVKAIVTTNTSWNGTEQEPHPCQLDIGSFEDVRQGVDLLANLLMKDKESRNSYKESNKEALEKIVSSSGRFPLILAMLGITFRNLPPAQRTLSAFANLVKANLDMKLMTDESTPEDYMWSLKGIWNYRLEELNKESKWSFEILKRASLLFAENIPRELLLPKDLKEDHLNGELLHLSDDFLFSVRNPYTYSVERLFQKYIEKEMGSDGKKEILGELLKTFSNLWKYDSHNPETWDKADQFAPHLRSFLKYASGTDCFTAVFEAEAHVKLLCGLSSYYASARGQTDWALEHANTAVELAKRYFPNSLVHFESLLCLGRGLLVKEKFDSINATLDEAKAILKNPEIKNRSREIVVDQLLDKAVFKKWDENKEDLKQPGNEQELTKIKTDLSQRITQFDQRLQEQIRLQPTVDTVSPEVLDDQLTLANAYAVLAYFEAGDNRKEHYGAARRNYNIAIQQILALINRNNSWKNFYHIMAGKNYNNLGDVCFENAADYQKGEAEYNKLLNDAKNNFNAALQQMRGAGNEDSEHFAIIQSNLADTSLKINGDANKEIIDLYVAALKLRTKHNGADHPGSIRILNLLIEACDKTKDNNVALTGLEAARTLFPEESKECKAIEDMVRKIKSQMI